MTPARRNASPVASGIAGAVSPGVQAAVAGSSPAKFRPSDFDCGGVDSDTRQDLRPKGLPVSDPRRTSASVLDASGQVGQSRCNSGPQSPICPELTAYITTLLAVVGAIAWAHVFAMNTTLANQLINFHPKAVICDGLGNKPEFLCAVSHKEGQ